MDALGKVGEHVASLKAVEIKSSIFSSFSKQISIAILILNLKI